MELIPQFFSKIRFKIQNQKYVEENKMKLKKGKKRRKKIRTNNRHNKFKTNNNKQQFKKLMKFKDNSQINKFYLIK